MGNSTGFKAHGHRATLYKWTWDDVFFVVFLLQVDDMICLPRNFLTHTPTNILVHTHMCYVCLVCCVTNWSFYEPRRCGENTKTTVTYKMSDSHALIPP